VYFPIQIFAILLPITILMEQKVKLMKMNIKMQTMKKMKKKTKKKMKKMKMMI
jgi:hypothetical protein